VHFLSINEYQSELSKLTRELKHASKGKAAMNGNNSPAVAGSPAETNALMDSLAQENSKLEEQIKDLKLQIDVLEGSKDVAPGMDYWKAEKETLMAMMVEKDNQVSLLESQLAEGKEAQGVLATGGQTDQQDLHIQLAEITQASRQESEKLQAAQAQVAELERQLAQAGGLSGDLASSQSRVAELENRTAQMDQMSGDLAASQARVGDLEVQLTKVQQISGDSAKRQLAAAKSMMAGVEELKRKQAELRVEACTMTSALPSMVQVVFDGVTDFLHSHNIGPLEEMRDLYQQEVAIRKKLHNQLVDIRGNIRVYCRVRPCLPHETKAEEGQPPTIKFPLGNEKIVMRSSAGTREDKTFTYERVFKAEEDQTVVFQEIEPLVTSVMDGYNVTIFAYGQTGSGKTFTMVGPPNNPGVNIRALEDLFRLSTLKEECQTTVSASMLEIYNETILDLLAEGSANKGLEIRQSAVDGLKIVPVSSLEDVEKVLAAGSKNRSTFSTNMNEHSSRSHCMFTVYTQTFNTVTGQTVRGKLHLVDLAGSERLSRTEAEGARLKEAQSINKSLSALGDVIAALAKKEKHIPFRNSKLTQVLQDSLEGTAKVAMFVNVSPTLESSNESVCSLNFASRVRGVELGAAAQQGAPGTPKKK